MVPSTGRTTARRASTSACSSDSVSSWGVISVVGLNFSTSPRSSWERMTPELPRAPISEPCAMAEQTASIDALAPRGSSSATTDSMVRVMLVPVSPSGTG